MRTFENPVDIEFIPVSRGIAPFHCDRCEQTVMGYIFINDVVPARFIHPGCGGECCEVLTT